MKKQGIPFAAATKGNAVSVIGRPQALQPEVKFRGGVGWLDDTKLARKGGRAWA